MFKSAARTIGICSGKGGVGKTYCAINIARSIANKKKKVLLIDCDFNLGNCAFFLGINKYKTLVNISNGEKIENCVQFHPEFDFIGADSGDINILDGRINLTETLLKVIIKLQGNYDYILLDFGAGLDKKLLSVLAYCDHRFVVVNPNNLSLKDSYAMMKVLKNKYGTTDFTIVPNKVSGLKDTNKIMKIYDDVNNRFLGADISYLPSVHIQSGEPDQIGQPCFRERVSATKIFDKVIQNFFEKYDEPILPFWKTPQKQDAFFARLRSN